MKKRPPVCTEYESDNYRIKVDTGAPSLCFDIYNQLGERLGAFSYNDIIIKHDTLTGKQLLISEHGTLSYDALVLDEELKNALCKVMGVESLETEKLQGFSLKTHAGTGIQYLLKDGEAGAGGRVLLQSDEDVYVPSGLGCQKVLFKTASGIMRKKSSRTRFRRMEPIDQKAISTRQCFPFPAYFPFGSSIQIRSYTCLPHTKWSSFFHDLRCQYMISRHD